MRKTLLFDITKCDIKHLEDLAIARPALCLVISIHSNIAILLSSSIAFLRSQIVTSNNVVGQVHLEPDEVPQIKSCQVPRELDLVS